MFFLNSLKLKY